ncbi:uncharacterized protein [Paramisgurnus dabryanus]|uniref:uncharacterized protein n=1 Tax=Paramisgurnus dabryanus TaxID=90735 RepID=UPI003CCF0309
MQLHFPKEHVCEVCGKSFSLKQHLSRHQKQHLYPCIRLYKQGEAKLQCTDGSASSQKSILSFVKAAVTYTPPLPQSPLPCARVLRRAHMIMEMEKMSGEILCIDGTKKVLKKIYGDGRGTMQYITSVLNEWGQFLTTVVVAAESEGCYRRMAKGLMAHFERARAPAPAVIYADNNCCRASSFLENLFRDWVQKGTVIRLDIRHWQHRWDAVVIKQSHANYGLFMSALAGAVLAYNKNNMMLLNCPI